jgi:hypothetical protein
VEFYTQSDRGATLLDLLFGHLDANLEA